MQALGNHSSALTIQATGHTLRGKSITKQVKSSNTNTNTHGKTRNTQIKKYRHTQIQILQLGVSARSEEERIEICLQKVVDWRDQCCAYQVQTLSLSLSRTLQTWNWTNWRAESSRKLLPLQRPQCELVSISLLVSENDSALSIALVCDIVSYLLNSVVIADMLSLLIFLVLILTCNDSLMWTFALFIILWFFSLYFMKGTK